MDCSSREEHYAGYDIDNDCADGVDDVMDGFGGQIKADDNIEKRAIKVLRYKRKSYICAIWLHVHRKMIVRIL